MRVFKPTDKVQKVNSIFLAGTIDMGNSEDWQARLTEIFKDYDVDVFNPRRDDWDSSWEQRKENEQFNHQVTWELSCLEKADLIVMYFGPESKSPISLLELGLFKDKNVICYCPKEFYREGNVDIVCDRYGIQLYDDMNDFELALHLQLHAYN